MANVSSSNGLEKYPKLRFKGFSEPWERIKLSDFVSRVTRKNSDNQTDIPLTISSKDGLINQNEFFSKQVASKDMSGYYLLQKGEFAYNKSYSVGFDFGSIKRLEKYDQGALSTLYICFALNRFDSDFIKHYFDSLKWYREIYMISAEGARNHGLLNVPTEDFFATLHTLPMDTAEQKKIADFLDLLTAKIEKQQALVDNLKKYKRGFFKSIISGQFANIGFDTAKWERKCLSELFSISAGGDIDKDRFSPIQSESHPYPVYANAKTNDGLYGYANYYKSQENTITVSGRGEVGFAVARRTKYVPIVRLLSLVPKESLDIDFYTLIINNTNIFVESTGVPQLTSPQLGKLIVPYAPLEEQRKIAKIFNGIDVRIANSEKELDALYLLRQSLLNKMFI